MGRMKAVNHNKLLEAMIVHDGGVPRRIQHVIKVYQFAKMIGEQEGLDEETQYILETAAIVHDIGIRPALEKYGSSAGNLQEQEGPAIARQALSRLGYDESVIKRVCYLVGHHHTLREVDGMDYQILLEADFLVNLYEDGCDREAVRHTYETVFRTKTGKRICAVMFGIVP